MPAKQEHEILPNFSLQNPELPAAVALHTSMDGTNRSVVMYSCRNFEVLNCACIAPESIIGKEATESWIAEGSRDDLLRIFSDYDAGIRSLLE
jgi:salicylate hydroxylase